jgi:hypothetical protein
MFRETSATCVCESTNVSRDAAGVGVSACGLRVGCTPEALGAQVDDLPGNHYKKRPKDADAMDDEIRGIEEISAPWRTSTSSSRRNMVIPMRLCEAG